MSDISSGDFRSMSTPHTTRRIDGAQRIAAEIGKLRAIAAPKPAKKAPTFDSVLERLEALNAELQKWPGTLDDRQRRSLGEGLLRLSNLAERWSVKLIQR